jgi:hypothetical protein
MPDIVLTPITPPRVPLIDSRTGLIDRAWYLFFLSLNNLATGIVDDVVGPSTESLLESEISEMQKQFEALQVQPIADTSAIEIALAALSSAPVTQTSDFTVGSSAWYINNKSGSTCIVTLPTAASYIGRTLTFKNMQPQTLVSASSNVVPIDSTTAGTAILLDVVGNWATMVSDGANWVIMQQASNNNLLLE